MKRSIHCINLSNKVIIIVKVDFEPKKCPFCKQPGLLPDDVPLLDHEREALQKKRREEGVTAYLVC